jgi:hypothetical protein
VIFSSPVLRGAPGRGSSVRPSIRLAANRRRHVATVTRVLLTAFRPSRCRSSCGSRSAVVMACRPRVLQPSTETCGTARVSHGTKCRALCIPGTVSATLDDKPIRVLRRHAEFRPGRLPQTI